MVLPPESPLGPDLNDRVPVGLYRSTPDGEILAANDTLAEILGYRSRDELLAVNSADLYLHPEDRERLKRLVAQRGFLRAYETQLVRGDGRRIWVELSLRVFEAPEGVAYYEGVILDVTERKLAEEALWESERRLRLLVRQVPAVLWSTDAQLRFTLSLGAGLARMGLRPNQVVGIDLFDFFETRDPEHPGVAAHRRALRGESVRFELTWADRAFEAYVEPLRTTENEIAGTLGVALDVTERETAEAAYRQIVESVGAVVWRGDPESLRFSFVSPEAERLIGHAVDRWTHEPDFWAEHLHPDDRERVVGARRQAARNGGSHTLEYRMIAADGRVVWLRDVVRTTHGADGSAESVGVMVDVSEEKRGQALRAALSDVLASTAAATDLARLGRDLHAIVAGLMPARGFGMALAAPGGRIAFPYFSDERSPGSEPAPSQLGPWAHVLTHGEPLLVSPGERAEVAAGGEIGPEGLEWLGVPLRTGDQTLGVLAVWTGAGAGAYSEAERDALAFVSGPVAGAVASRARPPG
jgi:PAS domain S-box-containing protein